jgi:hypothetical protein
VKSKKNLGSTQVIFSRQREWAGQWNTSPSAPQSGLVLEGRPAAKIGLAASTCPQWPGKYLPGLFVVQCRDQATSGGSSERRAGFPYLGDFQRESVLPDCPDESIHETVRH